MQANTFDQIIEVLASAVAASAMAKINDELNMRFLPRDEFERAMEKHDVPTKDDVKEMIEEAVPSDIITEDDLDRRDFVTERDVDQMGFAVESEISATVVAAFNSTEFVDAVAQAMRNLLAPTVVEESAFIPNAEAVNQ